MNRPDFNKATKPQELPLVSDSLRIVCFALILASAAILVRIVTIW